MIPVDRNSAKEWKDIMLIMYNMFSNEMGINELYNKYFAWLTLNESFLQTGFEVNFF